MTYQPHEFADLFPLMAPDEFVALKADIRAHGLRQPVMMFEGKVLDGRNRFRACQEVGEEIVHDEFHGTADEALAFVLSANLHRRHMTASQKAVVALDIETLEAKRAKLRQGARTDIPERFPEGLPSAGEAREKAAAAVGVNARYVSDAKALKEDAPELLEKVRDGKLTIPKANKEVKRREREERKAAAAAIGAAGVHKTDNVMLRVISCHDLAQHIEPRSVDWIITDPPYPADYLDVFADLGALAAVALKPGGLLLCMVGQSYLPDIIAALCRQLTYHWTLAYLTPGGQAVQVHPRKVNAAWKPVLAFSTGEYLGRWFGDVARSAVNDNDKESHHWGQSVSGMSDLVGRFVSAGDVVLDPFLGAGTTGIAAVALGAKFIGTDVDKDAVNVAASRLCA